MVKKLVGKLLKKKSFYGAVALGAALYFGSGSIGPVSSPSSNEPKELQTVIGGSNGIAIYRTKKQERGFSGDPAPSSNSFSISTYKPLTRSGDEQGGGTTTTRTRGVTSLDMDAYRAIQETPEFESYYAPCKDNVAGASECFESAIRSAAEDLDINIYK